MTRRARSLRTTARPPKRVYLRRFIIGLILLALLGVAANQAYSSWRLQHHPTKPVTHKAAALPPEATHQTKLGRVTAVLQVAQYTPAQVETLAKQNYGALITSSNYGVTQILFSYTSTGAGGKLVTLYARAYLPDLKNAPILAMAPGTTGVGNECAASLEQPAVKNWANYESDMMAYASQGYAGVITDYEGRDPAEIQPYMISQLEGQAVLDSIRGLENLPQAHGLVDPSHIFVAGYSQGGHATFATDALNAAYAPDIHLSGIIGWGPVMDVTESLADIEKGSTLTWFGPNLLVSYANYYQTSYPVGNILLPQWQANLTTDVLGHCIDSDLTFWGTNPAKVYTPQFLAALKAGSFPAAQFGTFGADMADNQVGNEHTATPKLINQGQNDNVVLPAQQTTALPRICASSTGPVELKLYPNTTHYTVMHNSFDDTLAWMSQIIHHTATPPTSCS